MAQEEGELGSEESEEQIEDQAVLGSNVKIPVYTYKTSMKICLLPSARLPFPFPFDMGSSDRRPTFSFLPLLQLDSDELEWSPFDSQGKGCFLLE